MRSEKAQKFDFWPTPDYIVDQMCEQIVDKTGTFLDNSVGRGAFIEGLIKIGVNESQITAYDIDPENIEFCKSKWPNINYKLQDYLSKNDQFFNTVIFNPPYSHMMKFLEKSFNNSDQVICIIPNSWAHKGKNDLTLHIYKEITSVQNKTSLQKTKSKCITFVAGGL